MGGDFVRLKIAPLPDIVSRGDQEQKLSEWWEILFKMEDYRDIYGGWGYRFGFRRRCPKTQGDVTHKTSAGDTFQDGTLVPAGTMIRKRSKDGKWVTKEGKRITLKSQPTPLDGRHIYPSQMTSFIAECSKAFLTRPMTKHQKWQILTMRLPQKAPLWRMNLSPRTVEQKDVKDAPILV